MDTYGIRIYTRYRVRSSLYIRILKPVFIGSIPVSGTDKFLPRVSSFHYWTDFAILLYILPEKINSFPSYECRQSQRLNNGSSAPDNKVQ